KPPHDKLDHEHEIYKHLQALQGNFILKCHGVAVICGSLKVLALEVAIMSLDEFIKDAETFKVAIDSAFEALQAVHAKGVLHRDIRLENFAIVERDGHQDVVVIDFGESMIESTMSEYTSERSDFDLIFKEALKKHPDWHNVVPL